MEIIRTPFEGLLLIKPRVFEDARGYFYESYNRQEYIKAGISFDFVQDNQSDSARGVIRGLHYQVLPHAQTKLVRVLRGTIYDVAVDLRMGAPTFGKHYGIELSGDNKLQLLIPRGFAHGFSVLSSRAVVLYKTDDFYNKETEQGILFNDPVLNIDWQIGYGAYLVSERDLQLPKFEGAAYNFIF